MYSTVCSSMHTHYTVHTVQCTVYPSINVFSTVHPSIYIQFSIPNEYILVIERTVPPSVFQTCVSLNLSPCSVRQSGSWRGVLYVYYRQSRKRSGETHVWKTQRNAVRSITNIYSLSIPLYRVYSTVCPSIHVQ